MDLEVRVVNGIESCFVSLPISLIQTLQHTSGSFLPPILALELRSASGSTWYVAWSGSASSSFAIEVSRHLAECISLPDHIKVQVKVLKNLPKAVQVSLEPNSADDWEILELNSNLAEDAILQQVGIVHEGIKIPLWLHNHLIVTFSVVSTFPSNSVVQLVPGTEVVVAPKARIQGFSSQDSESKSSAKGKLQTRALLRIQASNKRVVHKFQLQNTEVGVVLTSVVFIHPETAKRFFLDALQPVVIMPRLLLDENRIYQKGNSHKGSDSANGEINSDPGSRKKAPREVVVHLLFSDLVARGHVMLPQTLRHFLRAPSHAWIYVKTFDVTPNKNIPALTLCPCRFKLSKRNKFSEDSTADILENLKDSRGRNQTLKTDLSPNLYVSDWSLHDEFLSLTCYSDSKYDCKDTPQKHNLATRKESLLVMWLMGQMEGISSIVGKVDTHTFFLAKEMLLHFEIDSKLRYKREQPISDSFGASRKNNNELPSEIFFLLSTSAGNSSSDGLQIFELSVKAENRSMHELPCLDIELGEIELGEPVALESASDRNLNTSYCSTAFSLNWLKSASLDAISRLQTMMSPSSVRVLSRHHLPLPGHVLIYGPPGSGKTSLLMAVAKHLEEHGKIVAHVIFISCSKLALEKAQTIRQMLSAYISEALIQSPSLVLFDDLDHLVSSSENDGLQPSNTAIQLAELLTAIMDEYGESGQYTCGIGPIAFMASVQALGNIPQALTSSGRFDFHLQLPAPAVTERVDILQHEIHKRSLHCSMDTISEIASKCDGYDAYDLEILVDRAIHSAIGRHISLLVEESKKPNLIREDFSKAMDNFTPVSMRGLTKPSSESGYSGWDDIGGLTAIKNAIQETIEVPSKFPSIFSQAPLRLRSNILLYGPPGCGKTHIVGAAAAACSLRFISVKGPELLNKYIGASEQAVRDLFSKAASAAPCLLFFDEFDSIAPKRGHDNTGVTDRVVNQLLTELDGVEALTGVFVFAATSRPDLIDAALLRPGRLDRLLFCGFPSWKERLDIISVLSRKLPLDSGVNLEIIASMTEGFSGADLQALLSDAQLASVHDLLDSEDNNIAGKMPVITKNLLESVASKARPSVSESEKSRLHRIYSQFLDSKKSIDSQSRDAKGKRATLA